MERACGRKRSLRPSISPHEIRVESREAIPRLAAYLAERHDVGSAARLSL